MFSKMSGKGFIILNVLRVFNIISLITVVAASWVMLVRTVQTSNVYTPAQLLNRFCWHNEQFFFFDGVSHFITSVIGIFLTISELSLFKSYFARYWPLLSPESGFVFLGSAMVVLGFNILGNLNKDATSEESLGLPLWRIVIASGILTSVMGVANVIAVSTTVFFLRLFADSDIDIHLLWQKTRCHRSPSSYARRSSTQRDQC
jgi:hypothetical protein